MDMMHAFLYLHQEIASKNWSSRNFHLCGEKADFFECEMYFFNLKSKRIMPKIAPTIFIFLSINCKRERSGVKPWFIKRETFENCNFRVKANSPSSSEGSGVFERSRFIFNSSSCA